MAEVGPSSEDHRAGGGGGHLAAIIGGWASAATLIGGATVLFSWGEAAPIAPGVIVGLWLVTVMLGVAHVRVVVHGSTEAVTLSEVGVIPVLLLLPPHLAVVIGATAGLLAESIITRGQFRKVVFNTAWQVVALAAASWTFQFLAGTDFAARPRPLGAALVAAAVYVVINLVAIAAVLAASSGRGWTAVVAEEAASSLLLGYGAAQVGIVAAVMLVEAPWGLPFLALPALFYRGRARARSEGLARLATERDRFQRTVAGSSDGVVLLDPSGRVEVWNPVMSALTDIDERQALGRTLDELGWGELGNRARPSRPDTPRETRITRDDRTLSVRSSPPAAGVTDDGRVVLLIRDVSRETQLARLQEDLVTRVSHEIRTPLTVVMGLLDTTDRHWNDLPVGRRRELVHIAARGARRLGRLISNLESLARIEARSDGASPEEEIVQLDAVVAEVADAPERSEVLIVDVRGEPVVHAAPEDVRLILENLVGNAELYGAPPVELVVGSEGDQVVLSVLDHGPGVPPELRGQLFEPFSQGDVGLRRTTQGLGLGLAIVRSLVAASGGTVSHEEVPGGGSRFTVTLPSAGSGVSAGPHAS